MYLLGWLYTCERLAADTAKMFEAPLPGRIGQLAWGDLHLSENFNLKGEETETKQLQKKPVNLTDY